MHKLIVKAKPKDPSIFFPTNNFSKKVRKITDSKYFDPVIMVAIVLNILAMALPYDTMSTSYEATVENINLFFTCVFIIEMVLKMIAFGFRGYWINDWNKFDFFVVMSSIIDIIMNQLGNQLGSFLRVGP